MSNHSGSLLAALTALFIGGAPAAHAQDRPLLSGAALEKEMAVILPAEQENRWMEIPWRTNIMEALDEAARVDKPVFFWVMNGNPLGCA